ncbi:MAG TPA: acetylornithine transaminase [Actinomycetota bacterium]|nr:acetylornithine transaminase [Actinomycetota bacterium]
MTSLMMPTYKPRPVTFVSGHGSTLVAADGRQYLDLVAGIAVASVGHCHPKVVEAIANQARLLLHTSNLYGTTPQVDLAERLATICDGKLSFFGNSGAETIECATKLARKWALTVHGPGRERIVAAENGFHGRTYGALSATGQPAKQAPFAPIVPGFTHVEFGSIAALEATLAAGDVAAVLLEPIQGEAGVVVPPDGYLSKVRELCDAHGVLLILDEVQTGLARTGYWLAARHEGVVADIVCLAKALGGGLPIGACLAAPEVAGVFEPGDHASTFGGGPVQCAAALATLEVIDSDGLVARASRSGARFSEGLSAVAKVRGRGLLLALELDGPHAATVAAGALDAGVLVNELSDRLIRIAPPLVITDDEIDRAIDVLVEVIGAI